MNRPARYGLIGCPVKHSVSPLIHKHFAAQTGQAVSYELIEAPADGFINTARKFFDGGGRGLNVTLPFKQQAFELAGRCSEYAHKAGAVNTLVVNDDGTVEGHNTDGTGLARDLCDNHAIALAGQAVLIIGAGGAARGIVPALFDAGAARITVANRTPSRAEDLCTDLGMAMLEACALDALGEMSADAFDGVINATSASLDGEMPAIPEAIRPAWACDLVYAAQPTPFMRWFAERGAANVLDGFGMLIEQAAESFHLWRGVRPETAQAAAALRTQVFP